jgi:hypothetical protein
VQPACNQHFTDSCYTVTPVTPKNRQGLQCTFLDSRREGDMKTRKITEDFIVVERNSNPTDLIGRQVARAYRDQRRGHPPKPLRPPNRSREREYERRRAVRLSRLREGLCTVCSKKRGKEYVLCDECRTRQRTYNRRYALRKLTRFSLDHI